MENHEPRKNKKRYTSTSRKTLYAVRPPERGNDPDAGYYELIRAFFACLLLDAKGVRQQHDHGYNSSAIQHTHEAMDFLHDLSAVSFWAELVDFDGAAVQRALLVQVEEKA